MLGINIGPMMCYDPAGFGPSGVFLCTLQMRSCLARSGDVWHHLDMAQPKIRHYETGGILRVDEEDIHRHMALLKKQFDKSVADPKLRKLTTKLVGHRPDDYWRNEATGQRVPVVQAWGETFELPNMPPCPMKDANCESTAIWNFSVLNVRYTLDPAGADLFCTARHTLEARAGDCDDFVILMGAMHRILGFEGLLARVVATRDHWEHVYLVVGFPKAAPTHWRVLDPTVRNFRPGDEFRAGAHYLDFPL